MQKISPCNLRTSLITNSSLVSSRPARALRYCQIIIICCRQSFGSSENEPVKEENKSYPARKKTMVCPSLYLWRSKPILSMRAYTAVLLSELLASSAKNKNKNRSIVLNGIVQTRLETTNSTECTNLQPRLRSAA